MRTQLSEQPQELAPTGLSDLTEAVLIGQGGSARVFAAYDHRIERMVAVKTLRAEDEPRSTHQGSAARRHLHRDALQTEGRILGQLTGHPGVVSIHRRGVTQMGVPYLVLELCSGGTLQNRLQREGPLEPGLAIAVIIQIAQALAATHHLPTPTLHLDVKPSNLLITRWGSVKLSDFGVAAQTLLGQPPACSVRHGAPEQLAVMDLSPSTDLYSLASTLHALVTGVGPFRRPADVTSEQATAAIRQMKLTCARPPLDHPRLHPALATFLRDALQRDPSMRAPQTAEQFIAELTLVAYRMGVAGALPRIPVDVTHLVEIDDMTLPLPKDSPATLPRLGITADAPIVLPGRGEEDLDPPFAERRRPVFRDRALAAATPTVAALGGESVPAPDRWRRVQPESAAFESTDARLDEPAGVDTRHAAATATATTPFWKRPKTRKWIRFATIVGGILLFLLGLYLFLGGGSPEPSVRDAMDRPGASPAQALRSDSTAVKVLSPTKVAIGFAAPAKGKWVVQAREFNTDDNGVASGSASESLGLAANGSLTNDDSAVKVETSPTRTVTATVRPDRLTCFRAVALSNLQTSHTACVPLTAPVPPKVQAEPGRANSPRRVLTLTETKPEVEKKWAVVWEGELASAVVPISAGADTVEVLGSSGHCVTIVVDNAAAPLKGLTPGFTIRRDVPAAQQSSRLCLWDK